MNQALKTILKRGLISSPGGKARVYMKRLFLTGYENEWIDVSGYVVKFPKLASQMGDKDTVGSFSVATSKITFSNTDAKFSDETEFRSLFYGALSQTLTKFKIVQEFEDGNTTITANTKYFFSYGEISQKGGLSSFPLFDLIHILKLEPALGVTFTQGDTLAEMIEKLLKKAVNGARVFDTILEGATDAEKYVIPASTFIPSNIANYQAIIEEGVSVFEMVSRYCTFLNGFLIVNESGNFELKVNRDIGDTAWHFNYLSSYDEYGSNVVKLIIDDGKMDIYNAVYITYEGDAVYSKTVPYTPNSYTTEAMKYRNIYGEKKYEASFEELSEAEATEIGNRIFDYYVSPKKSYIIHSSPVFLKPLDKVILNAEGQPDIPPDKIPIRLNVSEIDGPHIFTGASGPINIRNKELKVIYSIIDLNTYKFKTLAKEV